MTVLLRRPLSLLLPDEASRQPPPPLTPQRCSLSSAAAAVAFGESLVVEGLGEGCGDGGSSDAGLATAFELRAPRSKVSAVAVSDGGRLAWACGCDVWLDAVSAARSAVATCNGSPPSVVLPSPVTCLAWVGSGDRVAAACRNQAVYTLHADAASASLLFSFADVGVPGGAAEDDGEEGEGGVASISVRGGWWLLQGGGGGRGRGMLVAHSRVLGASWAVPAEAAAVVESADYGGSHAAPRLAVVRRGGGGGGGDDENCSEEESDSGGDGGRGLVLELHDLPSTSAPPPAEVVRRRVLLDGGVCAAVGTAVDVVTVEAGDAAAAAAQTCVVGTEDGWLFGVSVRCPEELSVLWRLRATHLRVVCCRGFGRGGAAGALLATACGGVLLHRGVSTRRVDAETEEFWQLEERVRAHMQGHNEAYVQDRIVAGLRPLSFVLSAAEAVDAPPLAQRFERCVARLAEAGAGAAERRVRTAFHGSGPAGLTGILQKGLLPFGHPLSTAAAAVDDGFFGSNRCGVYVSPYVDYALQYSNKATPLQAEETVKIVMFQAVLGRARHLEEATGPVEATPGFDSHVSPNGLEWFLFGEEQLCPSHVLTIRAVENKRTAANDF